jgi:hypothetical protein
MSSMTTVAAYGFTYFYKRYCVVNLEIKRERRYCFAKFALTITFCKTIIPIPL